VLTIAPKLIYTSSDDNLNTSPKLSKEDFAPAEKRHLASWAMLVAMRFGEKRINLLFWND
jgi:hypothetical protein